MLCKEVCKKCVDEHSHSGWLVPEDENRWRDDGFVFCPLGEDALTRWVRSYINERPPGRCWKMFEQAVAAGLREE
jgi:hypothetical protein